MYRDVMEITDTPPAVPDRQQPALDLAAVTAVARHVKAALMHLSTAVWAAAGAGVDVDGEGTPGILTRAATDAVEDLDQWAIGLAEAAGVVHTAYAGTERWCAIPGGVLPTTPAEVEWTREQVLAYLAEAGMPVAADTWSGYVSRGQAPAPARRVGRTPLWDPAEVRAWQAARRGRGWRASTADQEETSTPDTALVKSDAQRRTTRYLASLSEDDEDAHPDSVL